MPKQLPTALEVIVKAYKESNGKTVDLVIEHGELPGLTMEHMRWWSEHMHTPARYKMWHTEDHISHEVKTVTDKNNRMVRTVLAEEKIGEFPASVLRMRPEDPDSSPVKRVYKPFVSSTMLGPNDEAMGGVYHESEETPTGLKMHSTFRFPSRTPQKFLDAMREHSRTEMANLPKFLPALFQKETGNK